MRIPSRVLLRLEKCIEIPETAVGTNIIFLVMITNDKTMTKVTLRTTRTWMMKNDTHYTKATPTMLTTLTVSALQLWDE